MAQEKRIMDDQIDLHVLIVPLELWLEKHRKARNTAVLESVSAGFIRVAPSSCLHSLRDTISDQLGTEIIPPRFIFLRCVGRCLVVVNQTQEVKLSAAHFAHPTAHSELLLLPSTIEMEYLSKEEASPTFTDQCCDSVTEHGDMIPEVQSELRCSTELFDESNYVHCSDLPALPVATNSTESPSFAVEDDDELKDDTQVLTDLRSPFKVKECDELLVDTDILPNISPMQQSLRGKENEGFSEEYSLTDFTEISGSQLEKDSVVESNVKNADSSQSEIGLVKENNSDSLMARIQQRIKQENTRLEEAELSAHDIQPNSHQEPLLLLEPEPKENIMKDEFDHPPLNLENKLSEETVVLNHIEEVNDGINIKEAVEKEVKGFSNNEEKNLNKEDENEEMEKLEKTAEKNMKSENKQSHKRLSHKVKKSSENAPKYLPNTIVLLQSDVPSNAKSVVEKEQQEENNKDFVPLKKSQVLENLKKQLDMIKAEKMMHRKSLEALQKKRQEMLAEISSKEISDNNAWKRKYLAEKSRTSNLEEELKKLRKLIETQYQKSTAVSNPKVVAKKNKEFNSKIEAPSEKSNQRNMVVRLQNEISQLNMRLEVIKKQLAEESTLKAFALQELKELRHKSTRSQSNNSSFAMKKAGYA